MPNQSDQPIYKKAKQNCPHYYLWLALKFQSLRWFFIYNLLLRHSILIIHYLFKERIIVLYFLLELVATLRNPTLFILLFGLKIVSIVLSFLIKILHKLLIFLLFLFHTIFLIKYWFSSLLHSLHPLSYLWFWAIKTNVDIDGWILYSLTFHFPTIFHSQAGCQDNRWTVWIYLDAYCFIWFMYWAFISLGLSRVESIINRSFIFGDF